MFKKIGGKIGTSNMFRKGLSTLSAGAKNLGGASNQISRAITGGVEIGNAVLSNPVVRETLSQNPEAQRALELANKIASTGASASKILKMGSSLINPSSYKNIVSNGGNLSNSNIGKNIGSGLQRAKEIQKASEDLIKYVN